MAAMLVRISTNLDHLDLLKLHLRKSYFDLVLRLEQVCRLSIRFRTLINGLFLFLIFDVNYLMQVKGHYFRRTCF